MCVFLSVYLCYGVMCVYVYVYVYVYVPAFFVCVYVCMYLCMCVSFELSEPHGIYGRFVAFTSCFHRLGQWCMLV
jgi:hypothetical protein